MKSSLRAAVDSNIVISAALLPLSVPRQVVNLVLQTGCLLFSESMFLEIYEVMHRRKFDKYISEQGRLEFFWSLVNVAEIVPVSETITACRDPSDNKVLELAVSGGASDVVTGDADLLALHPFRGIDILQADAFLRKWRA